MSKRRSIVVDTLRRRLTETQNHVVDEFVAGYIDRRAFLRHGAVMGLSLPVLSTLAGAFGNEILAPTEARAAANPGGTVRVAMTMPTGPIDPVTIDDQSLVLPQQTGEFLAYSSPKLMLAPVLAESWSANSTGDVWSFKIRKGVKFHNGKPLTADDVVATFDRLSDPKGDSNALSVFGGGVLTKGGTRRVDDYSVEFHLDAPNGNFPYLVSSDNYNAVILPADYAGDFEKTFIGTGAFKLDKYTPKVGVSFVRNPDYWGPAALPDRTEFSFYGDLQAELLALQGRQVDIVNPVPVQGGQGVLKDPRFKVISVPSSAHQQVHMRTDMAPFTDKRVRRAIALCLDRKLLVKGLFNGRAVAGNDSPFAPIYPSTDSSVPQREQNLAEARQLLAAAGFPNGFNVKLTTEQFLEIPKYAVILQNAAKRIGVHIDLSIEAQMAYYGKAVFGQSDWLDAIMGITDYGHRGVPNTVLSAPLKSDGVWNSAHFKSKEYDSLVSQYVAAVDLQSQRAAAGKIQRLLLDESPVIFAYFYNWLVVTTKNLSGVGAVATGQLYLQQASFT
jgi:peptide/nickel transport system substrate-binding protein